MQRRKFFALAGGAFAHEGDRPDDPARSAAARRLDRMRRRALLLGIGALAATRRVWAQTPQPGRIYRVALILTSSPVAEMMGSRPAHPFVRSMLDEMRRLGYMDGRNFILERRSAEGRSDRHEAIIAELLQLKCDALVTINIPLTLAAKKLTSSVPIRFVIAGAGDPVAAGVVSSLARPGANITGHMADAGPALSGKRLELLRDAFPRVSRVAFLGMRSEWNGAEGRGARSAAEALAIELFHAETGADDYAAAFEAVRRGRADALLLGPDPAHFAHREPIVEFATRSRLPDMHAYTSAVRAGGLMSYGSESSGVNTVAYYLHRILSGTRPGDLPVQRPRTFIRAVNLKAARARGLTVSPALLLRAEEVIE